jgi:hypothetical protein
LIFLTLAARLIRMTSQESAEFDKQLSSRGWRYDVGGGQFFDGELVLDWEDVIGLIAGLSLDDLTSWEDAKYDEWAARKNARAD